MSQDDVSIEVRDNALTISGERKAEKETHERGWYRVERQFGRFSRSLTLPEGVDPDSIKAEFDNGVLVVTIPKPEQRKPRRVQIGGGGQANPDDTGADGNGNAPVEGAATER
jgi:HSP20 family protein